MEGERLKGCALRIMTPEEITCPGCGYGIEFFHDETKRTCPRCGREVARGKGDKDGGGKAP